MTDVGNDPFHDLFFTELSLLQTYSSVPLSVRAIRDVRTEDLQHDQTGQDRIMT